MTLWKALKRLVGAKNYTVAQMKSDWLYWLIIFIGLVQLAGMIWQHVEDIEHGIRLGAEQTPEFLEWRDSHWRWPGT